MLNIYFSNTTILAKNNMQKNPKTPTNVYKKIKTVSSVVGNEGTPLNPERY